MYPVNKPVSLLSRRKIKPIGDKQTQFQQKFESFQFQGYQISFSLVQADKLHIQAISLQSLCYLHSKSRKKQNKLNRQKNRQLQGEDQYLQQQQPTSSQQQQQDDFSFHYIYELTITKQYLTLPQHLNRNKFTASVSQFFNFIKLLIQRHSTQVKHFSSQQFKKHQITLPLTQQPLNELQQARQKQRKQFLMNYDRNLFNKFKSKYVEIEEKGRDFDNKRDDNRKDNQRNQTRRRAKLQAGGRIKQENLQDNEGVNAKKDKNSYLVLKFKNIFEQTANKSNAISSNESKDSDTMQTIESINGIQEEEKATMGEGIVEQKRNKSCYNKKGIRLSSLSPVTNISQLSPIMNNPQSSLTPNIKTQHSLTPFSQQQQQQWSSSLKSSTLTIPFTNFFFQMPLKSRLLQSYEFTHRLINYNFHQHISMKKQLNSFIFKTIQNQKQLLIKTNQFMEELQTIAESFQQEAVENILKKLDASLKVKREKKLKFKEVPEEFVVNGVNATFEYRNTGGISAADGISSTSDSKTGNKMSNNDKQREYYENHQHYNNQSKSQNKKQQSSSSSKVKLPAPQPQLQVYDPLTSSIKIPIQFDEQTGSYHQFSISDNVVSRNGTLFVINIGGSSYQILHFKYRLSMGNSYTCTMRLIKTYRRVCWLGIMQEETKNFIHTSKMQNCIVYHTCHGRVETHLKKQQGLEVVKKKGRGMMTLYDGHWVRMVIDLGRWEIEWELDDGVKVRCRIPDQLRGMALRPVVILQIIGDTVEFIDV